MLVFSNCSVFLYHFIAILTAWNRGKCTSTTHNLTNLYVNIHKQKIHMDMVRTHVCHKMKILASKMYSCKKQKNHKHTKMLFHMILEDAHCLPIVFYNSKIYSVSSLLRTEKSIRTERYVYGKESAPVLERIHTEKRYYLE